MITVGNYPDLASARLAQSVLDAEGIFTNIPDEDLDGIGWQMGTALHGIRLQVAPEDVDRAAELLATAFMIMLDVWPQPAAIRVGTTHMTPPQRRTSGPRPPSRVD